MLVTQNKRNCNASKYHVREFIWIGINASQYLKFDIGGHFVRIRIACYKTSNKVKCFLCDGCVPISLFRLVSCLTFIFCLFVVDDVVSSSPVQRFGLLELMPSSPSLNSRTCEVGQHTTSIAPSKPHLFMLWGFLFASASNADLHSVTFLHIPSSLQLFPHFCPSERWKFKYLIQIGHYNQLFSLNDRDLLHNKTRRCCYYWILPTH